ncbi:putative NRPS-like protein biosynthetic cluster [Taiwanofungus camphoratus]|nr:putative NRPS-like protein biosynthetic cluster [Antrodia cinnamomea]
MGPLCTQSILSFAFFTDMTMDTKAMLPPLDGSLPVLPGFVDFHAKHNPELPFCVFPYPDLSSDTLGTVSFLDFAHATHRIAHAFRPGRVGPEGGVVAIIVNCDTLLYHALVAGLVRAGLVPFPMSQRNSAPAIASLMQHTGCHRIVSQPTLALLTDAVRNTLPSDFDVQVDDLPALADVFPALASSFDPPSSAPGPYPPAPHASSPSDVILYLHSSGSTGLPKPVPMTHTIIIHWCHLPILKETRARAIRWGCMALPPFHTMGLTAQLYAPLVSGQPTALFTPRAPVSAPPIVPTPQNTIETARKTGITAIESVPAFVEAWAQNEEDIKFLASLKTLVFAGGPLSTVNGEKLVAGGVRLFACYGATEFGTLTCLFDDDAEAPISDVESTKSKTRADWEWMQLPKECSPRWAPQGDGTYELQLLSCPTHQPSIENLPNGERGYATSDIWEQHPTKPGLWRIVGRTDDVIVLGSGEKTVPIPQEKHIGAHPHVAGALMFGRGHQQVGVLVEPRSAYAISPGDDRGLVAFRNAVWPQVEEANSLAPTFSRIFKEMILIADPARPFVRAAKGTAQRKKTLGLYAQDIDALYKTVEDSSNAHGVAPPPSWDGPDVQSWLAEHAATINGGKVPIPAGDLFEQGFDSLSATYLRNRIIGTLRTSADANVAAAVQRVPQNFIFMHPTLAALTQAVVRLVHPGANDTPAAQALSPAAEIEAMIEKYTALLPPAPAASAEKRGAGAVVLLTGSTGALGAHILALLLADARVRRVYALNRGARLAERQKAAFDAAELPADVGPKLVLLSGDFGREDLGLGPGVLDELRASVTHVVHNAWRVDFNLALASFETHVAAAVRLLALAPRARYLFTSSVSVAGGWRGAGGKGSVPEAPLGNARIPAGSSGYGMGKYVVEEVLAAARARGLRTTSLRIGQISGSRKSGAWNTAEWVPSIVKSSVALGCLPELDGVVSWVPMDTVAAAAAETLFAAEAPALVNISHPRPITWRAALSAVNKELAPALPFVPLDAWVHALTDAAQEAAAEQLETIPGIKLLEYFRSLAVLEAEAREQRVGAYEIEVGGLPVFATAQAERVSPSLAALPPLGEQDARAWVRYWKSRRFIE